MNQRAFIEPFAGGRELRIRAINKLGGYIFHPNLR